MRRRGGRLIGLGFWWGWCVRCRFNLLLRGFGRSRLYLSRRSFVYLKVRRCIWFGRWFWRCIGVCHIIGGRDWWCWWLQIRWVFWRFRPWWQRFRVEFGRWVWLGRLHRWIFDIGLRLLCRRKEILWVGRLGFQLNRFFLWSLSRFFPRLLI